MHKIRAKYLRLSEETNALDSLAQSQYHIQRTESDVLAWKWVILSLHSALYGFAICALKGTNPDNVTFQTKAGKEKLISFNEALNRCQDPRWMKMTSISRHLQLSASQRQSVRWLKDAFRNRFEHYIPTLWSIEIHSFPTIALDVLEVIRFLALDTGNYVYLKESQMRKIKSIIFQSKTFLLHSKLYRESKIAVAGRKVP